MIQEIQEKVVTVFTTPDGATFNSRASAELYIAEKQRLDLIEFIKNGLEFFYYSRDEEFLSEDAAKWVVDNIDRITEMINKIGK